MQALAIVNIIRSVPNKYVFIISVGCLPLLSVSVVFRSVFLINQLLSLLLISHKKVCVCVVDEVGGWGVSE